MCLTLTRFLDQVPTSYVYILDFIQQQQEVLQVLELVIRLPSQDLSNPVGIKRSNLIDDTDCLT